MISYEPEQWRDFFLLVGTGAVTLTGLVFVAMSLNPKSIAHDATHRYRSIGTLTGLAAVFLRCALALMGGLGPQILGAEFLIVAGAAGCVYVYGYIKAIRAGSGPSIYRTGAGTGLYLVEVVGAAWLISGSATGLYVVAAAMVVNTCYMISGAWLLIMGVAKRE